MAGEREQILDLFRDGKKLSTSQIVNEIYSEVSEDNKHELHRKAIYYLNKLVDDGILKVKGYLNKGEKLFELTKELVVELPGSRIKLEAKNYELKDLEEVKDKFITFEPFGITVNSVCLDAAGLQLGQLRNLLKDLYKEVNDAILIKNFDMKQGTEVLHNFFSSVAEFQQERKIVLLLDFSSTNMYTLPKLLGALNQNIEILLLVKENDLLDKSKQLKILIEQFRDSGNKINISKKNERISFPGRAGTYSYEENDKFLSVLGMNQIILDLDKIRELPASEISALLKKLAKSMHAVVVNQLIDLHHLWPVLSNNKADLEQAKNYFRFWNFVAEQDEDLLGLLSEIKSELVDYCINQENIYKSCGLPLKFELAFSTGFNSFAREKLSKRAYKKNVVKNFEDLMSLNNYLSFRRKQLSLFDSDRLRIFRQGTEDISRELQYLIQRNFPLITYDYRALGQELNLRDFM